MVEQKLIEERRFEEITRACEEVINLVLGLRIGRIAITRDNATDAAAAADFFARILGNTAAKQAQAAQSGPDIRFTGPVQKGARGQIALACRQMDRALFQLKRRGIVFDSQQYGTDAAGRRYHFLQEEIGGFSVQLVEQ